MEVGLKPLVRDDHFIFSSESAVSNCPFCSSGLSLHSFDMVPCPPSLWVSSEWQEGKPLGLVDRGDKKMTPRQACFV